MNASEKFVQFVMEKGFVREEAEKILEVYKKHRIIKFSKYLPQFEVKHGAFLESDVLRRALSE